MSQVAMSPVQTASESAYQTLVRAIIEGTLAPNEALSDRQISLQLGVSRTPIREAFHQLEAAGLVRRRGRVGWVVTAFDRRDVAELIELRSILEVTGVEKVVCWGDKELKRVTSLFDDFTPPVKTSAIAKYLKRDHELHMTFVNATGNRRIIDVYRYVEWHIERIRHFISYRTHRRVDQSLEEHRRICRALEAREAGAAAEALTEHLANVKTKMLELLEIVVSADSKM